MRTTYDIYEFFLDILDVFTLPLCSFDLKQINANTANESISEGFSLIIV